MKFLHLLDRAIDGHPRHHLRMREMLARSAYLPDSFVRLFPSGFEKINQLLLQSPRIFVFMDTGIARDVKRVHYFAVNVQLKLLMGRVANTHWTAALIASQPRKFKLRQRTLTREAIHNLQIFGVAGD